MNRVNFNSLSAYKAPEEWLDKAASIPETAPKKRAVFPIYRAATAASLVLVSVIGLLTFLFFGNQAPVEIRERESGDVSPTEAGDSVPIPDDGSYPSLDTVFPTIPQVVPTDADGNPVIEPATEPTSTKGKQNTSATEPTTAKGKKKTSATEPGEKVPPTQKSDKATESAQSPTQGVPEPTEAATPTNPPVPTDPPQQPTEDQGEVVAGNLCFTAIFPASLIEEGEPIYCIYWEQGVDYPSVEMDLQADYTVMDNGMVVAVYDADIILPAGTATYEYQFCQNGKVLARGTQAV